MCQVRALCCEEVGGWNTTGGGGERVPVSRGCVAVCSVELESAGAGAVGEELPGGVEPGSGGVAFKTCSMWSSRWIIFGFVGSPATNARYPSKALRTTAATA